MNEQILTCIGCPMGCRLQVTLEGAQVISVSGNTCRRGDDYARKECTAPERTVCGTVRITGAAGMSVLPVRTASPLPKDKVLAAAEALRRCTVRAPIALGDIVLPNVAGTGVDMIATRSAAAEN